MPGTFFLSGDEWRRHRHVLNPAFTISKLKMMSPLINGCISDLMKILSNHAENGEEFNIYLYYKRLTMDVICRRGFGLDFKLQNNSNNIYLQKMQELFDDNIYADNLVARLVLLIPEFGYIFSRTFSIITRAKTLINIKILPLISKTKQLSEMPIMWFVNRVKVIVDQRIEQPTKQVDILQLMSKALIKKDMTSNTNEKNDWLTEKEVVGNIVIFLTAGYETTSTALGLMMYELARHPDILEKLQHEIDQLEFKSDPNNDDENAMEYPDYEIVSQLPYMDMVISEVLRMYPIANVAVQRRALDDTIVKGIHIQKGTVIPVDLYSVHFDPDLWGPEDPYSFIPERHQTKRHPMAHLAFGAGPRICIGMRFALIEVKILLTRLLRDYNILPGEHLESKFTIHDRTAITPGEIWIKLAKRNL
ncbi:hypothetical protein I4U23_027556 [Adineta vaga]|nr:hypothetical protein I4U23_027556 [Adineta vaga]